MFLTHATLCTWHFFLLRGQQHGKNPPETRIHFTSEPPARTSSHRTCVPFKVSLITYNVYWPHSYVHDYHTSTLTITTAQKKTAQFTSQPHACKPSRCRGVLARTTQSFERVFRPRRGVPNNYSGPVATDQFALKALRTAQVKTQTRPCHGCANVDTSPEDI